MNETEYQRMLKLESVVVALNERMNAINGQHEALMKRNVRLALAVRAARLKAETVAAQPYYLGTGHDAGAHYGDALREVAEMLKLAESEE
jgi:hypothetical protein